MSESRTSKSLKNGKVALFYSAIAIIATFFFRKAFIESLGAELLGLNTTITNLLQFLNLAELGIGSAIAFTLYRPIFEKDTQTINEIVSVQGWLYRRVAYVVIAASAVLMCFFPIIFEKTTLPLWYPYATFGVLLLNALLGYFVNYNQVVLNASQENYKVLYVTRSVQVVKLVLQCVTIYFLDNGYVWWLLIEGLAAVVAAVVLYRLVARDVPFLNTSVRAGGELRKKYTSIIIKTKQLFVHKIGEFVLTQTQTIIIYGFTSLTLVAYYGNYLLIITGMTVLMVSVFNGMSASVGNLVSEGNKDRIVRVFEELYSIRFMIVSTLALTAYYVTPHFIVLWLGEEYIMGDQTLKLMLMSFFIAGMRTTVSDYLQAYGLYHDMWAPVAEAVMNIGLSVLFGYFWGLNGILLGAIVSLVLVIIIWKPYFLFTQGINVSVWSYIRIFSVHILSLVVLIALMNIFRMDYNTHITEYAVLNFLINGSMFLVGISVCLTLFLSVFSRGMRDFLNRAIEIVQKNK